MTQQDTLSKTSYVEKNKDNDMIRINQGIIYTLLRKYSPTKDINSSNKVKKSKSRAV